MNKIIYEDCLDIIKKIDYEKLQNKSFLITGASGMLGSYISYVLKVLNDDFNMNIHIILNVRDKNKLKEELLNDSNVEVIVQDVINPFNYEGHIDYIVHAASPASPKIMVNHPFETNIANTIGTYNTLMLAKEKDVLGYLFISSREVYGEPIDNDYFKEDGMLGYVNPLIPRNSYAEGKKAAENMCVSMKDEYGINTKIVRLAHTYGPGMSVYDGRVQADFLKNVINNENIVMKSEGTSIRTYTYVADAVLGIFKVLLSSKDIVYNIADDKEISIKELAEVLVSLSNNKSKLIMQIDNSLKKGSASFTKGILSNEKIKKELGWNPKYNVHDGFLRTIEYLKEEMLCDTKVMIKKH